MLFWIAVGVTGFLLLPWYALQDSIASTAWLADYASKDKRARPVAGAEARPCLAPAGRRPLRRRCPALVRAPDVEAHARRRAARGRRIRLRLSSCTGLRDRRARLGLRVAPHGLRAPSRGGQYGMGWGAALCAAAFTMLFALGLAERGYFNGDAFIAGGGGRHRGVGRDFHVLPGGAHPVELRPGPGRRVRAVGVRRANVHREDLGRFLPRRRWTMRRGLEHAGPRLALRRGAAPRSALPSP